ncbi:MAG: hypothetical protein ACK559_22690, partial [bacterium]
PQQGRAAPQLVAFPGPRRAPRRPGGAQQPGLREAPQPVGREGGEGPRLGLAERIHEAAGVVVESRQREPAAGPLARPVGEVRPQHQRRGPRPPEARRDPQPRDPGPEHHHVHRGRRPRCGRRRAPGRPRGPRLRPGRPPRRDHRAARQ